MPFSTHRNKVNKPYGVTYPENPKTLGEHIKKKRMELRLPQKVVAKIIGVTTDTITNWENNRTESQIKIMPRVLDFLGYNPFTLPDYSLGNRLKQYRINNGLSMKRLGRSLHVNGSTISEWENKIRQPNKEHKEIIERVLSNL